MPTKDSDLLDDVQSLMTGGNARITDGHGREAPIPAELYDVLTDVVDAMQAGHAIVLTPVSMRMTTGEAASFLDVSRPTLVKLLEDGKIPFDRPNRHRYVKLEDLRTYQEQHHHEAVDALTRMTREAAEDGLYDVSAEDFEQAIDEVRETGDA